MSMPVEIKRAPSGFHQWQELLALLHAAFAFQNDRIDPPSSLHKLDAAALADKSKDECMFLAFDQGELVGCAFAKPQAGSLYVGKVAVQPQRQGQGIGRLLMEEVERFAHEGGHTLLELNTRIELTENHQTFGAWGFVRTAEHAHEGYDRTTFITMQKRLGVQRPVA
jgi:GNAT superfamily N-acetyltransferase